MVVHFKTPKERLDYLKGKFEEITPVEVKAETKKEDKKSKSEEKTAKSAKKSQKSTSKGKKND